MTYNWQLSDWPDFTFDQSLLAADCQVFAERLLVLSGKMSALGAGNYQHTVIEFLSTEARKSARIEGEHLDPIALRSSLLNGLYPAVHYRAAGDVVAGGFAAILLSNRRTFAEPLTESLLFDWHQLLLGHRSDLSKVRGWRTSSRPMRIVSGSFGKEFVHFEAPPAASVGLEMQRFLRWFNELSPIQFARLAEAPLRAGLAHLYFESIHPFSDGNGRIGRVLVDRILSQGLKAPVPLSFSAAVAAEVDQYYTALHRASHTLDATDWLQYFLRTCLRALDFADTAVERTLFRTAIFTRYREQLKPAHEKTLRKMLAVWPLDYQGGLTARKYAAINRVSKATATRELSFLLELGILRREGRGRAVSYQLVPKLPPLA